jgi:hypothetical protein
MRDIKNNFSFKYYFNIFINKIILKNNSNPIQSNYNPNTDKDAYVSVTVHKII